MIDKITKTRLIEATRECQKAVGIMTVALRPFNCNFPNLCGDGFEAMTVTARIKLAVALCDLMEQCEKLE